jgi:hypothetical protein
MENLFITAAVVAIVQALKAVQKQDWLTVAKIVVAAVIGVGAGLLEVEGLDVTQGLIAGLSAAGIYTVGSVIAQKK